MTSAAISAKASKKCQKVFKKADTQQRADFMARFHKLYAQLHRQKIRLVYIDEAHIYGSFCILLGMLEV